MIRDVRAVLRAQSIKVAICQAPTAGSAATVQPAAFAGPTLLPALDPLACALHRDGPLWHLVFRGRPAILKHQKGLCYVAEMLSHPGQPIKKLSLAVKGEKTSRPIQDESRIVEDWLQEAWIIRPCSRPRPHSGSQRRSRCGAGSPCPSHARSSARLPRRS